jgi:hypothetical protein
VQDLGAFCSFVAVDGSPLAWLQKIDAVGRNGLHAVVVAPQLVRIQMFRNERTYQLLITEHRLEAVEGVKRPRLSSLILFHGINGTASSDFVAGEEESALPVFRTRSGDVRRIPGKFEWTLRKIAAASSCFGSKHCHLLEAEAESVCVTQVDSTEVLRP